MQSLFGSPMLKKILLKTLNKFLGSYVENIDKHQLELGIFKGYVSVSNLRIKSSVISRLFEGRVISNCIGTLRVLVPWKSFSRKPIEIYIKDIDIKLGKAGFCWCFLDEKPCIECVKYEKYEFMSKLDKLSVLSDAREESPVVFEDLIMKDGFRILIENVNLEYVSGESIGLKIQKLEFSRKDPKEMKNGKVVNINGVEVSGGSKVAGPFNICGKVWMSSRDMKPKIEVNLDGFHVEMKQQVVEKILRGSREYIEDRVRWTLFRNYLEYRQIMKAAREMNLWEDQKDPANSERSGVIEIWRRLIKLQKKAIESKGVLLEDVSKIVIKVNEYREILKVSKLSPSEVERKKRYEKEIQFERLLKIKRSHCRDSERKSWKNLLSFIREGSSKKRESVGIPASFNVGEVSMMVTDEKHQGFKMVIPKGRVSTKNLLSPFKIDFKGNEWKLYFIDARRNEYEPHNELISFLLDVRGTLTHDGPNMYAKGIARELRVLNYRRELPHCFENLMKVVRESWVPSYQSSGSKGKTRIDLKVDMIGLESDLERFVGIEPSNRYGIECGGMVFSYVNDGISIKKAASLTVSSSSVYWINPVSREKEALSNRIETSVLLVDNVFYVKTSMVDLYAHGVCPNGFEGNGVVFPVGFVVPNFEVCSDAIRINGPKGMVELRRIRMSGNGGTIFDIEIFRGKILNEAGRTVCRIPRMKAEARIGKVLLLDIKYLRICGMARRISRFVHGMPRMPKSEVSTQVIFKVGKVEGAIKCKGKTLNISVSEYFEGLARSVNMSLDESMADIEDLEVGEEYKCKSAMVVINKEDVKSLKAFERILGRMGNDVSTFKATIGALLIRLVEGLEMEVKDFRIFKDEVIGAVCPFEISISDTDMSGILGLSFDRKKSMKIGINRFEKSCDGTTIEGSVRGEIDERVLIKMKDQLEGVSMPSGTSEERSSILFDISLGVVFSERYLKIECPLILFKKTDWWEVSMKELSVVSDDGEHISLFGINAKNGEGATELFISRIEMCLEPFRFASTLHPLLSTGNGVSCTESTEVRIDEVCISNKEMAEIRIRNVKYNEELTLDLSISNEPGSKVTYKKVNSNGAESFFLSMVGGWYEANSLITTVSFCSSEYMKICKKFGIQMSKERFHVLVMDLTVMVDDSTSLLRINLPVGYFDIQELHSLRGRILCSSAVYNPNSMEFVPFVEENVFVVKKCGSLLDIRALSKLRILYLHGITNAIVGLFGSKRNGLMSKREPLYCKINVRNITCTPLWVKTKKQVKRIKNEESDFAIGYDEHDTCIGEGEAGASICIVDTWTSLFVSEGKTFVIDVLWNGKSRIMTITYKLSFLNLCKMEIMGRMHCLDGTIEEVAMPPGLYYTIPQEEGFFLEIGAYGKYSGVVKIDANTIGRDGSRIFGTVCRLDWMVVGVDIIIRDASGTSSILIIVYPTFEVMNRTTSTLNLMFSVGKDDGYVDEGGVLRKNIPFFIGKDCREDVYDIDFSEIPLVWIQNLGNQSKARIFHSKPSILIEPGHSGEIRKEKCEIDTFFGKHTLIHRIRMGIWPFIVVENHLGNEVYINGTKFCPGTSCSDEIKVIYKLCAGEYSTDVHITVRKKFVRTIALERKSNGIQKPKSIHEGLVWTNEAIFGGLGPRIGVYPRTIRLLLGFKEESGRRTIELRHAHLIKNQTQMRLLAVSEQVCYYVEPCEEVIFNTSTNGFYLFDPDCMDNRSLRSSGAFIPLDIKTTEYFKLQGSETVLLSVNKSRSFGQYVFSIRTETNWPYMLCNDTDIDLKFTQNHDTVEHDVLRDSVYKYVLDSLVLDPVILLCIEDKKIQLDLNKDGVLFTSGIIVSIAQSGTTRIVRVSKRDMLGNETRDYLKIVVDGLAMSLVDREGDEVVCGHLKGMEITLERVLREIEMPRGGSSMKYVEWTVGAIVESIQVDNQNVFCVFPVILHPLDKSLRMGSKRKSDDKFLVFELTVGSSAHHVSVSNLYCRIQDFALNIEESLAMNVSKMLAQGEDRVKGQEGNIRIQNLKMERIRAKVNFLKDVESDFISNVMGLLINNISDFSLEIDGMKESCLYTTFEELKDVLTIFYMTQLKKNLYKVITHLDLIGNIGSFTESVSMGIKDLLTEPTLDTSVTHGIVKGGKSFLKNTIYGVSNTVGKFSKSIGTGARFVGCDVNLKHAKVHHPYSYDACLLVPKTRNSKGSMRAILKGTGNFFDSITRGMAGIAISPVEGASQGVAGVVKGLGKGLLGAFTRPIAEVADLITDISDVIKTSMNGKIKRIQYPRPTRFSGWHDEGLNQGFYIFTAVVKKTHEKERFIDGTFGDFNGRCQLILTTERLLVSDSISILDVNLESIVVEENTYKLRIGEFSISVERPSFSTSVRLAIERRYQELVIRNET
ncbi:vacuolar protein sorting-associated protein [Encephalitozoon romaleae SJ-2008]|uniref:Vacuolar protein sorting-associated protein n=1 Tax=Encephalitozoon romaleae (strain SJ-2008) TaxID=1178016 RepID=I7ADZ5_ENCRO|nr:vacuolar protein sorting-associated protein [Encephalitozoon romaleae SJ-2008]AFN82830.1 vacuolar protein sorting-associated protein [Encephalitozoon romaleae SJ-2008]